MGVGDGRLWPVLSDKAKTLSCLWACQSLLIKHFPQRNQCEYKYTKTFWNILLK